MIYAGIDGKEKHCIAVISETAEVLLKPVFVKQTREEFEAIEERLSQLTDRSQMRIGMEASGHYWTHFFRFLTNKGWTVELINPVLSNAQARRHLRGRKTDKDDALAIAKTVRDGGYIPWKIPSKNHADLKQLCRTRAYLIDKQSDMKRHMTSLIDQIFPEMGALFQDLYAKTPMALLSQASTANAIAAISIRRLTTILSKASKGRHGAEMAKKLRETAKNSVAYDLKNKTSFEIPGMIRLFKSFAEEIGELDSHIEEM